MDVPAHVMGQGVGGDSALWHFYIGPADDLRTYELLAAEIEERESRAISRLLHEAKLPRMKTLDAFEFDGSSVSSAQLHTLAEGDYVAKAEPILLVGEADTGKTHLGNWALCRCLPSAAPGPVHHLRIRLASAKRTRMRDGNGADQRVGRGCACQPTQPRARSGTPRPDLY